MDVNTEKIVKPVTPFFKISLAQWSLHKAVFNGTQDPIDFAEKASELGFEGIEYVSTLYKKKVEEMGLDSLIGVLNEKSKEFKVRNVLIMIDGEGSLASTNEEERNRSEIRGD